jgi:hypothetical protein
MLLILTEAQSTQRAGVTCSTFNHWENRKRPPLLFLIKRLPEIRHALAGQHRKHPKPNTPR